jgi:hypothetical protein
MPIVIQSAWKTLYPSVICLNSGSLLTVMGSLFSHHNKHELVFDYQRVAMADYLKGTYVKPFPLSRSSVVSPGLEVIGSSFVTFDVPFSELSDAIDIHVFLRINDEFVPVDRNPDFSQLSLPLFTSAAEFDPEQLQGIVSYYDARDLKSCGTPSCLLRWHPRAGITGALVGTADLQNGWVMSPAFTSESNTKIMSSNHSTLIVGFVSPPNYPSGAESRQFIVSHGSLPSRARMALWSQNLESGYVHWADDLDTGRSSIAASNKGPVYWVGSYSNSAVKQSINTADHFQDLTSVIHSVSLNTEDTPLVVGSCLNPTSSSCNFTGGVKFVILFNRALSSEEHLNIARWAHIMHSMPSFDRSIATFVRPFGIFPGSRKATFSACAKPLSNADHQNVTACQTHPFQLLGHFSNGVSCISAHRGSFRLSLSGGFYARSPRFQGENWLLDPTSSFVCEVSSVSGFIGSVTGIIISANYTADNQSNYVNNVIIECDTTSLSLVASLPNSTFRYSLNSTFGGDHVFLTLLQFGRSAQNFFGFFV